MLTGEEVSFGIRILRALKWAWNRTPFGKIADLEKRVAALEAKLQRAPGERCPKCGELDFRVEMMERSHTSFGQMGARDAHYKCGKCGFTDTVLISGTKHA